MSPISIPGKVQLRKNYYGIGPLDFYGGAAAAYSLRSLSAGYTGSVVRVRRDNDNAEQDFTATEVSDGTLAAWVGAGNDGFVRTWYDQSGNGNNMVQASAALQPQIVDNGSAITVTAKPAIQFATNNTTSNIHLASASLTVPQPITLFGVANRTDGAERQALYTNQDASLNFVTHVFAGWNVKMNAGVDLNYQPIRTLGKQLHYGLYNGTSSEAAVNGAVATIGNAGTNGIKVNSRISGFLPSVNVDYAWIGHVFEFIIYPSNQSSNRAGIEDNINTYYSIY